jgi:hypothetical protein
MAWAWLTVDEDQSIGTVVRLCVKTVFARGFQISTLLLARMRRRFFAFFNTSPRDGRKNRHTVHGATSKP